MKGLRTVVGAGVLVLALGACGQTQTTTLPGNAPVMPVDHGGSLQDVPAAQVDASKLPADYPKRVQVGENGAVLTVRGEQGGCEHVGAQVTAQDATSVHVLLTLSLMGTKQVCTKELRLVPLTVRLDKPLADRKVVLEQRTVRS